MTAHPWTDALIEKFADAAHHWDLERLYRDLATAKQQQGSPKRKELTPTEKACLRGLLTGWGSTKLAIALNREPKGLRVDLSRGLYRYVETLTQEPVTDWREIASLLDRHGYRTAAPPSPPHSPLGQPMADWGEALDVEVFFGRQEELETLQRWVLHERCRVVLLVGMGGIGKTYVSIRLARSLQPDFEVVIWRSLRNAPPLADLLANLFQLLQADSPPLGTLTEQITHLLKLVRHRRCLLVLDNFESILHSGDHVGPYQPGYEAYGELVTRWGESLHRSALVLTSREKPRDIACLEGTSLPIRSLLLRGLSVAEGCRVLQTKGIPTASAADWQALIDFYAGNPLALKMIAATIQDVFAGNIGDFLRQGTPYLDGLDVVLSQQFSRLAALERHILYWLAIGREPMTLAELHADLFPGVDPRDVLAGLVSLHRRSLIEKQTQANHLLPSEERSCAFTLQPVVMEYVTQQLIHQVVADIQQQGQMMNSHALIKAQAKDYVRDTQVRLILRPIVQRLTALFGTADHVHACLSRILERLKQRPQPGYAGGNLFNVWRDLRVNLRGYDFSGLTLWQAYGEGVDLAGVNFAGADLARTVWTETLTSTLSVAFSPDGVRLATATASGEIFVWRTQDGQKLMSCQGHRGWVHGVAFSPDGRWLVSGSEDGTAKLWDGATGHTLRTLVGHHSWVWSVAVCPVAAGDGAYWVATGSNDHTVKLWDPQTGQCLHTFKGHRNWVWSVAFSPDGTRLASASRDATIRLWDLATGTCLRILKGHRDAVWSVAFSPDGLCLASGSMDRTIKLWDPDTGVCLNTLSGHENWVQAVAFHPGGQTLASGSNDQTIRIWDVQSGQCCRTLAGGTKDVWSVAFHPEGTRLVHGSSDQRVRIWDVQTSQCLKTIQGYPRGVRAVTLATVPHSSQMWLVSSSDDHTLRVWDLVTGACLHTWHGHSNGVWAVAAWSQRGWIASGSNDQTIKLWDLLSGTCLRTLSGHSSWVRSVAFQPGEGRLASGSTDQTIKLWDPLSGECLKTLTGHQSWIRAVAFSADGSLLASSSDDQTIRLWDPVTGECLQVFSGHRHGIWSVAFSPHQPLLASGGDDRVIRIWDLSTGQCRQTLKGHRSWIRAVAFSPDGSRLASGSEDETLKVWDMATGTCLQTLNGHNHWIQALVWGIPMGSDEGIATGSADQTIKLWNLSKGICEKTLRATELYEGMEITGVKGLTVAQKQTLKDLGAVEKHL